VLSLVHTECFFQRTLYTDLVFMTVSPLVVAVVIWIIFFVRPKYSGPQTGESRRRKVKKALDKGSFALLFLAFLVYPAVSQTIFSALVCETFEGGASVLAADYRISCDADNRFAWVVYVQFVSAPAARD